MNKVSRKIDGGIQSEYLSMYYRPSEDKSNNDLNKKCGALTLHMAIADITGKKEHISNVIQDFCEALLMCKKKKKLIILQHLCTNYQILEVLQHYLMVN